MEVGILGLAGSGKTTVFSLLTGSGGALAAALPRDQAAVGMGRVPDPRLDRLSEMYQPRKITPALVRYVDVPAVGGDRPGEASLNIPELRTMDALLVVVRAFASDAVPHPLGPAFVHAPLRQVRNRRGHRHRSPGEPGAGVPRLADQTAAVGNQERTDPRPGQRLHHGHRTDTRSQVFDQRAHIGPPAALELEVHARGIPPRDLKAVDAHAARSPFHLDPPSGQVI